MKKKFRKVNGLNYAFGINQFDHMFYLERFQAMVPSGILVKYQSPQQGLPRNASNISSISIYQILYESVHRIDAQFF